MTKTALITGAARRVGAAIAEHLHDRGLNVVIHYRHSKAEAEALCEALNQKRHGSAASVQGDLADTLALSHLIENAVQCFGRLDVLVNNASSFYPTPMGEITPKQWDDLFAGNCKAPLFLSQAALPYLEKNSGAIVNIVDAIDVRPQFVVYSMAKSALVNMTKILALECGDKGVRVNAVAPGAILPAEAFDETSLNDYSAFPRVALKDNPTPLDVAKIVYFLAEEAERVSGKVIKVDGGMY